MSESELFSTAAVTSDGLLLEATYVSSGATSEAPLRITIWSVCGVCSGWSVAGSSGMSVGFVVRVTGMWLNAELIGVAFTRASAAIASATDMPVPITRAKTVNPPFWLSRLLALVSERLKKNSLVALLGSPPSLA